MWERIVRAGRLSAFALFSLLVAVVVHATDVPDAAINPISGSIELTEAVLAAGRFQVHYVEHPDGEDPTSATVLSESEDDDLNPRIDVNSEGNTSIVWWRDSSSAGVFYRSKALTTGAWIDEIRVSAEGEIARHPEIAHSGSTTWIVYESPAGSGVQLKVVEINDGPEPIPIPVVVGASSFSADVDVFIHGDPDHVWVSWIDSSTTVAWTRLDVQTQTWTNTQWESTEQSSVAQARAAIRVIVLGE